MKTMTVFELRHDNCQHAFAFSARNCRVFHREKETRDVMTAEKK